MDPGTILLVIFLLHDLDDVDKMIIPKKGYPNYICISTAGCMHVPIVASVCICEKLVIVSMNFLSELRINTPLQ